MAGGFVGPFEYMKVTVQASGKSLLQLVTTKATLENMIKAIPSFAFIFAMVCGLEFSVNDRIHKSYGTIPGLMASGFTGALFLTAADHLMFRQHHQQNFFRSFRDLAGLRLFTGFLPMMMRESIFIANVAYLGPATGQFLKKIFNSSGKSEATHDFRGRMISGLFTTLISQPFDVLARSLQHRHLHNQNKSILDCLREMQSIYKSQGLRPWEHPLLRGAIPRLFLAASGGAIAGGLYDKFKNQ